MLEKLKATVLHNWKDEAEQALYSASKQCVDFNNEARLWGGALTYIPNGVSYKELQELLKHI